MDNDIKILNISLIIASLSDIISSLILIDGINYYENNPMFLMLNYGFHYYFIISYFCVQFTVFNVYSRLMENKIKFFNYIGFILYVFYISVIFFTSIQNWYIFAKTFI